MKILVAVDGSSHSLAAVQCVIDHAGWYREKPGVELLTVHLPAPTLRGMSAVIGRQHYERYYSPHVLVGPVAENIVEKAVNTGCELICIGSRGLGDLGKALLGSTATQVLNLSSLPVLLVKRG